MKRRGLLFGLVAAPLLPAIAKAPAESAPQLLPGLSPWCEAWIEVAADHPVPISRIVDGGRFYDEEYLRRVFRDVTSRVVVDDGDRARMVEVPSSYTDWKYLVEALADRPLCFSGEAPVGAPRPWAMDEDGWQSWRDRRGVEILRVKDWVSTTPSDSCEASRIELCDADCAGSGR